jgi:hypothetical protein
MPTTPSPALSRFVSAKTPTAEPSSPPTGLARPRTPVNPASPETPVPPRPGASPRIAVPFLASLRPTTPIPSCDTPRTPFPVAAVPTTPAKAPLLSSESATKVLFPTTQWPLSLSTTSDETLRVVPLRVMRVRSSMCSHSPGEGYRHQPYVSPIIAVSLMRPQRRSTLSILVSSNESTALPVSVELAGVCRGRNVSSQSTPISSFSQLQLKRIIVQAIPFHRKRAYGPLAAGLHGRKWSRSRRAVSLIVTVRRFDLLQQFQRPGLDTVPRRDHRHSPPTVSCQRPVQTGACPQSG